MQAIKEEDEQDEAIVESSRVLIWEDRDSRGSLCEQRATGWAWAPLPASLCPGRRRSPRLSGIPTE